MCEGVRVKFPKNILFFYAFFLLIFKIFFAFVASIFLGIRYGEDLIKMYKHDLDYLKVDDRAKTFTIGLGFRFGE